MRGAYELAAGYAAAMSITESWAVFWGGLGALLLGGALFIGLAHSSKDKGGGLAMLSILFVGLFVAWKASFVRADHHHIYTLFVFLLLAVPWHGPFSSRPTNTDDCCWE